MTYVITEACSDTKDRSCVSVCPVDCIEPVDELDTPQLYIDPDNCIDCGACLTVCPVQAIYREKDLPAEMHHFIEINASHFV